MANRSWANKGSLWAPHCFPVLLDCNFIVDSTQTTANSAGSLGIRSLKGPGIQSVIMNSASYPALSPAFGTARSFAVLGASAVTNTGSSVLTGNLGISPGTSITGFPPGSFTGQEHIADSAAAAAKASAQASYTDLQARSFTGISSVLDGQSLTAGVYKATSGTAGTFALAASGAGTLTLTGSATDVFVFQTTTTLTTGAGGVPTITLAGGALASNVYWVVGSSATINSGSAGTFNGNIIAQTSITDTLGGTVNGSLIALTGAVTLSAATIINAVSSAGAGSIIVNFEDDYFKFLSMFSSMGSMTDSAVTSVVDNVAYVISSLGTATLAQWQAVGLPVGFVPAVGVSFVATVSGSIGGSAAVTPVALAGSGIDHIEVVGNPDLTISNSGPYVGAQIVLQCFSLGLSAAPADGSKLYLAFLMSNSSVLVKGE